MANSVIVCEPQCIGFEHSIFNAALLSTVLIAYPESSVIFMAERDHLQWVKEQFSKHESSEAARVDWCELSIPPRAIGGLRRVLYEWGWCIKVFLRAKSLGATVMIFSSLAESGIIVLKSLAYLFRPETPILVVIHAMINALLERRPFGFLFHGKALKLALTMPHPFSLRYLLLGESLVRELTNIDPDMASRSVGLDIPYLWPAGSTVTKSAIPTPLRFGFFGVSREKGFSTFYDLAKDIQGEYPDVEFELVGYLSAAADRDMYAGKLKNLSTSPLSPEEYSRRANGITYAVWTTEPERYRLCASSSFLDILSYVKPGIYLRNLYLEHNFQRMGDIGYLCDNVDAMRSMILSIIKNPPEDRYREQQRNIHGGRGIFAPTALAPRLRALIEKVRSEC